MKNPKERYPYLGRIALSTTRSERLRFAWEACKEFDVNPDETICGLPQPWFVSRMIWANSKSGPKKSRLSQLDAWRVVVDFMHTRRIGVAA